MSSTSLASSAATITSTGCSPADWHLWWQQQSIATHTDWTALLDQHDRIFQQLRQSRGFSS
jgi:hypothetical protein